MPKYELECPYCRERAVFTFTLRTGSGVLRCPRCGGSFQIVTKDDAVVEIRAH